MDVNAYLRRLNYAGSLRPDAATLRALHRAHLMTVPFENLSIHLGERIVLDDAALFEKVVRRGRGGFCYELNGLFAALLASLGFRVSKLSAGVVGATGEFGPDFDHMALLVSLDEPWLADVGFGDSFREPLRLNEPGSQAQDGEVYRIDTDAPDLSTRVVVRAGQEAGERPLYRFGMTPHVYADYSDMCAYHQSSPESPFTRQQVTTRATVEGRMTLSGRRLLTARGGDRQERLLADETQFRDVLRGSFGIDLSSRDVAALWTASARPMVAGGLESGDHVAP